MLKTLLDVIVVIQMAKIIKHGKGGADVTSVWLSIVQHNPAHQQIPISSPLFSFLKVFKVKADDSFGRARGMWHSLAKA